MTSFGQFLSSPEGVLLVDKPKGMTSHDVVARLRRIAGTRRIGHTGTLDPMATGLLVVCIGAATRVAQFLTGLDKVYVGTITLGAMSSTYDAEGEIVAQQKPLPDETTLRETMERMTGEKMQLPPPFSAIKVAGKKLYEYARAGEPAPLNPRPVRIRRFDLIRFSSPVIEFAASVGSGTYIRSLAHDLGLAPGCGAYLSSLRRTRVGAFAAEDSLPLNDLELQPDLLRARMLSISEALVHLPKIIVQPAAERTVRHGGKFNTGDILEFEGSLRAGQPVMVLDEAGHVLSVAQGEAMDPADREATDLVFKPLRVLA